MRLYGVQKKSYFNQIKKQQVFVCKALTTNQFIINSTGGYLSRPQNSFANIRQLPDVNFRA